MSRSVSESDTRGARGGVRGDAARERAPRSVQDRVQRLEQLHRRAGKPKTITVTVVGLDGRRTTVSISDAIAVRQLAAGVREAAFSEVQRLIRRHGE